MTHTDALDPNAVASLLESVGGDEEFLGELFSAFAAEAPSLLQTVEQAATTGDAESLRHAAHTLKSTSASLGALRLSAVGAEIEAAARSGTVPPGAQVAELRALVEAALEAMSAMVPGQ
jgi:HPt (histidine-containing phosphotransfer) domain-containing protein